MTPKQLARIAKALAGKTIARVDMRPVELLGMNSHGADPLIEFTDGTVLRFYVVEGVEENQHGMLPQGVNPIRKSSRKKSRQINGDGDTLEEACADLIERLDSWAKVLAEPWVL